MARKDYYLILGVSRRESPRDIQDAFRELAKRYHPDLAGPAGAPRFQDVREAYEVLSDPEKENYIATSSTARTSASSRARSRFLLGADRELSPWCRRPCRCCGISKPSIRHSSLCSSVSSETSPGWKSKRGAAGGFKRRSGSLAGRGRAGDFGSPKHPRVS
jgi:curved DNA-binding protein CbpA